VSYPASANVAAIQSSSVNRRI